jgi:hypothetical protein
MATSEPAGTVGEWTLKIVDRGDDYAGPSQRFLAIGTRPIEHPWRKTERCMGKPSATREQALETIQRKLA